MNGLDEAYDFRLIVSADKDMCPADVVNTIVKALETSQEIEVLAVKNSYLGSHNSIIIKVVP